MHLSGGRWLVISNMDLEWPGPGIETVCWNGPDYNERLKKAISAGFSGA
jgi:hypothetical protein